MDYRAFQDYSDLYGNLRIGDAEDTSWDHSKPSPSPPHRHDSATNIMIPNTPTTSQSMRAPQLLFHILHLTIITSTTLSTYLSTETLLRDLSTTDRGTFTLAQNLSNSASLLLDMRGVLRDACADLQHQRQHEIWLRRACVENLMAAAQKLQEAVGWVPDPRVLPLLPGRAMLMEMERLRRESEELREGKWGEEGWKECWGLVEYRPVPPPLQCTGKGS